MSSAAVQHTSDPPAYVDAQRVVRYNGQEYGVGARFPMHDDHGGVLTYAEVRERGRLWVNVNLIGKSEGKRWSNWYFLKSTKRLVREIEARARLLDPKTGSQTRRSDVSSSQTPPLDPNGSSTDWKTGCMIVDDSRAQYQGVDSDKLRGTWVTIELATAYAEHISPALHAKWCVIKGKVYSGDHSAVADVLVETDRVAGTESTGTITTKRKQDTGVGGRVKRGKLGDIAAFMDPGVDVAVALYERNRIAQSPEYMTIVKLREEGLFCDKRREMIREEREKTEADIRLLQLQHDLRTNEDYLPPEYQQASAKLRNVTHRVRSQQQPGLYVFVSKYGSPPCLKIGQSLKDVTARVKEAATWHVDPNKRLIFAFPVDKDRLKEAERYMHLGLAHDNVERELFLVDYVGFARVAVEMAREFMELGDTQDLVVAAFT